MNKNKQLHMLYQKDKEIEDLQEASFLEDHAYGDIPVGRMLINESAGFYGLNLKSIPVTFTVDSSTLFPALIVGEKKKASALGLKVVSEAVENSEEKLHTIVITDNDSWRGLVAADPAHTGFYSLGNTQFHPAFLNLCKVPDAIPVQRWIDILTQAYQDAFEKASLESHLFSESLHGLYQKAGCFDKDLEYLEPEEVSGRSSNVTLHKTYESMKSSREQLRYAPGQAKNSHDIPKAFDYALAALSPFARPYSTEYAVFSQEGHLAEAPLMSDGRIIQPQKAFDDMKSVGIGQSISELLQEKPAIVLETKGLQKSFMVFFLTVLIHFLETGFFKDKQVLFVFDMDCVDLSSFQNINNIDTLCIKNSFSEPETKDSYNTVFTQEYATRQYTVFRTSSHGKADAFFAMHDHPVFSQSFSDTDLNEILVRNNLLDIIGNDWKKDPSEEEKHLDMILKEPSGDNLALSLSSLQNMASKEKNDLLLSLSSKVNSLEESLVKQRIYCNQLEKASSFLSNNILKMDPEMKHDNNWNKLPLLEQLEMARNSLSHYRDFMADNIKRLIRKILEEKEEKQKNVEEMERKITSLNNVIDTVTYEKNVIIDGLKEKLSEKQIDEINAGEIAGVNSFAKENEAISLEEFLEEKKEENCDEKITPQERNKLEKIAERLSCTQKMIINVMGQTGYSELESIMQKTLVKLIQTGISISQSSVRLAIYSLTENWSDFTNASILDGVPFIKVTKVPVPGSPNFHLYELTDVGEKLYCYLFGKPSVESEAKRLSRSYGSLGKGYGVKKVVSLLKELPYIKALSDSVVAYFSGNGEDKISKSDTRRIYCPDIVIKYKNKDEKSVKQFVDYETGDTLDMDFINKCIRIASVSKYINFIVPNNQAKIDTIEKIDKFKIMSKENPAILLPIPKERKELGFRISTFGELKDSLKENGNKKLWFYETIFSLT